MTSEEKESIYCVHDDLVCGNDSVTDRFCAHIFIAKKDELLFGGNSSVIPENGNYAAIRNGTVTFIKFRGKEYGVTCRHVQEQLDQQNSDNDKKLARIAELPLPDIAKYHFFISKGQQQIHLNTRFFPVPSESGMPSPDIAIGALPPGLVESLGKSCITIGKDWNSVELLEDRHLTGIACGYPEMNRKLTPSPIPNIDNFGKSFVVARAKFDTFSERTIRIVDVIEQTNGINVLSGMSGGPLFWSTQSDWGLAGIVKHGGDLYPNIETENDDEFPPAINIVAEPVTIAKLEKWTEKLSHNDFPPPLTSSVFIPKGFKGFRVDS
ncbi:hypothetical protein [Geomonas oryzae]|uniref:hypothetical protein n=1 Tax=Geomonas oryzae TaxID=2364273 RepID=UPI00100B74B9|nr:hypothetical protein [Geomonas oryzae]